MIMDLHASHKAAVNNIMDQNKFCTQYTLHGVQYIDLDVRVKMLEQFGASTLLLHAGKWKHK